MGHFSSSTTALKKASATPANKVTLAPFQIDFSEYVLGSVFADQAGTLEIQETFDYPLNYEDQADSISKAHWITAEKITIAAKESKSFKVYISGPYCRLVFTNTAEADQTEFRLYARAQEKGRI